MRRALLEMDSRIARRIAATLGLALVAGAFPVLAQGDGYLRRVPLTGIGSGSNPDSADAQRIYGNRSSCISVRNKADVTGWAVFVNKCDVSLYVRYCSTGDPGALTDCSTSSSSKVIDGMPTYGSPFPIDARGQFDVPGKPTLNYIWLACDQKQGLAFLAGDPRSPKGFCGDGVPGPNQVPPDARVAQGTPANSETTPLPIVPSGMPAIASRASSAADDLFASALSKSPEELRAEIAAQRARANAAAATSARSSQAESEDTAAFFRIAGAIVGGYVAGKTGDTALLELATGQPQGSLAGTVAVPNQAMGGGGGGGEGGGGIGGSSSQCASAKNRFQNDLSSEQARTRDPYGCGLMRSAISVWGRNRASVAQACAGTPNYAAMIKETDDYVAESRRRLAQSSACR